MRPGILTSPRGLAASVIIIMIKWIRTSRLSIKKCLSGSIRRRVKESVPGGQRKKMVIGMPTQMQQLPLAFKGPNVAKSLPLHSYGLTMVSYLPGGILAYLMGILNGLNC